MLGHLEEEPGHTKSWFFLGEYCSKFQHQIQKLLLWQDVMVVGEPSLMGGEFGEEDERLITRLENQQYDPSLTHSLEPAATGGGEPVSFPSSLAPWERGIVQALPPSAHDMDIIKRSPPNS